MNNTIVFLRHAETKKDPNIQVSKWVLTREGEKESEDLARKGFFDDVDVIICSAEHKAYQTASPIAKKLRKTIIKEKELNELDRDKGKVLPKEEYDKVKTKILEDLDYASHGWETSRHALNRFRQAVEKIDNKYSYKKILIVSHGTVMSLYFAYLKGDLKNLLQRWKSLRFCAWGIVKEGKVIKDII